MCSYFLTYGGNCKSSKEHQGAISTWLDMVDKVASFLSTKTSSEDTIVMIKRLHSMTTQLQGKHWIPSRYWKEPDNSQLFSIILKDDLNVSELDLTPNWARQDNNGTDVIILTDCVYVMMRKRWVLHPSKGSQTFHWSIGWWISHCRSVNQCHS